ncbi:MULTISPECIES: hypothetical protein [unclassified Bacillus (in: firmicutes)]|uniref:hypothetical protein n=1 Tax=unclassified Bacillus (in: firmicutes) TaxID=185979 RepID=UPI000BF0C6AC|nr:MULTISPECIES: hypothetical protein [unclassified Bacillus (in: firmicutes)]PEJ59930.1 hypothetical protein CN692_03890 [Bacillus sp. AFS002410]PEL06699.1 hypothetical protein CN601_20445 [Bacillus sp. AFS017336]
MYDYRHQIEQPYYQYSQVQQNEDERFFPFFFPFLFGAAAFGPWGWGRPWGYYRPWGGYGPCCGRPW